MRSALAVLTAFCMIAIAMQAEEVDLSGDPEAAADPWDRVEAARGTTLMAQELESLLLAYPHGAMAARARIEQAAGKEDLLEAAGLLKQALAEDPLGEQGARAAYELSRLEYLQGRLQGALMILEDARGAKRNPELEGDWLYQRAICRLALKGYVRAQADFELMLKAHPEHPQAASAALGIAECLAGQPGKEAQAWKAFEAIYQVRESVFGAQALWGAGALYERSGKLPEAKALFTRLAGSYPFSYEAHAAKEKLSAPSLAAVKLPVGKPAPFGQPRPRRFSVQVGAFGNAVSAETLARTLRARKYPVRVEKTGPAQSPFLVKVGTYKARKDAQSMATRLLKREKQTYMIVED